MTIIHDNISCVRERRQRDSMRNAIQDIGFGTTNEMNLELPLFNQITGILALLRSCTTFHAYTKTNKSNHMTLFAINIMPLMNNGLSEAKMRGHHSLWAYNLISLQNNVNSLQ